jgi:threonine/homoserine/homoserine lactone efflux protein
MFDISVLPIFILAVLTLAVTPGQDLALIIARGIGQGQKVAFYTALGFALAGMVQIPAAAFGLAILLKSSPAVFQVIKIAGALYLIYLGVSTLRNVRVHEIEKTGIPILGSQAMREGFIASLLNPKAIIFIFVFLPQFADSGRGNLSSQISLLGILMKLIVFIVEASGAFASGYAREWFVANPTRQTKLQYLTGIVLCLLGVSIFFAR